MPMPIQRSKTVRFAYKNIFHSSPPTPALSSSTITPPSRNYSLPAPFGGAYSSSHVPSPNYGSYARPHRYLDVSGVSWDIRDHPSLITRNYRPVSGHALYEPATNPPMPFIRITSPHLPWSIKVSASNGTFVTVEDVFEEMYRSLRANIRQSEFNMLTSPNDRARASHAYENRYRRLRSARLYEEEKRAGMKRVDFLMGRTCFAGMSNSGRRPDEWQLNLS